MNKTLTFLLMISLLTISCKEKEKKAAQITPEIAINETPFFKLSLAQWSLHKAISDDKTLDPIDFAEKASELGFEGIEYVSQLYNDEIKNLGMSALLDSLKAKSELFEVENVLIMIDDEGDLASTDVAKRNEAVENHKKWVDAAQYLGCHAIRVNTFGTNDPELWVKAAEDGLRKLSAYAALKNINVLVENHGWMSSDAPKVVEVMNAVNMENCGTLPDFGNWCTKRKDGENWGDCIEEYPDMYEGIQLLMPFAKAVSAKSYDFDEEGNETKIDYARMLQIVKDAGYTGFIGVEYEGENLSEEEGIIATKNLLLKSAN
ncbi:MAG: sugar phosphate isomerase/epimerase [Flavobacteriaceae bacterium]|nr:sugar phosphate isomerase/epimerase [Flavobacteriaceae bacterium]